MLDATAPSKKIYTPLFLRYGLLTGSTPYSGDKFLSNKQLILGNLNMLNASPPLTLQERVGGY
jgi:hypothetical protein